VPEGIVQQHHRIGLVVANAGIDRPLLLDRYDWRQVNDHFATNVTANVVLCAVLVPTCCAREPAYRRDCEPRCPQRLSLRGGVLLDKAALATFVEGLRAELAPGTSASPRFSRLHRHTTVARNALRRRA